MLFKSEHLLSQKTNKIAYLKAVSFSLALFSVRAVAPESALRSLPIPNLPSNSSLRASNAFSLRSKRAHSTSTRDRSAVIAGPSSDARLAWAAARLEAGVNSKCYGGSFSSTIENCGKSEKDTYACSG
jgi:hypothetical protein